MSGPWIWPKYPTTFRVESKRLRLSGGSCLSIRHEAVSTTSHRFALPSLTICSIGSCCFCCSRISCQVAHTYPAEPRIAKTLTSYGLSHSLALCKVTGYEVHYSAFLSLPTSLHWWHPNLHPDQLKKRIEHQRITSVEIPYEKAKCYQAP